MDDLAEGRIIPGFPGYRISRSGRIISFRRGLLKPSTDKHGYHFVGLTAPGIRKKIFVHTLVMLTFDGPRPEGLQINHLNGNKKDNRLSNLEYVTPLENMRHAYATGLIKSKKGIPRKRSPNAANRKRLLR